MSHGLIALAVPYGSGMAPFQRESLKFSFPGRNPHRRLTHRGVGVLSYSGSELAKKGGKVWQRN